MLGVIDGCPETPVVALDALDVFRVGQQHFGEEIQNDGRVETNPAASIPAMDQAMLNGGDVMGCKEIQMLGSCFRPDQDNFTTCLMLIAQATFPKVESVRFFGWRSQRHVTANRNLRRSNFPGKSCLCESGAFAGLVGNRFYVVRKKLHTDPNFHQLSSSCTSKLDLEGVQDLLCASCVSFGGLPKRMPQPSVRRQVTG